MEQDQLNEILLLQLKIAIEALELTQFAVSDARISINTSNRLNSLRETVKLAELNKKLKSALQEA